MSNIRGQGPRQASLDTIYQHGGQVLTSSQTVLARCDGPCTPLFPTLRAGIHNLEPSTPILSMRTLQTEMEGAFSSQEALGFLSSLFAALAMLLVATGIYGVLSYNLTRRTREVGIRLALGASPTNVARLFVSEAAVMLALGALIGVPAALAAATLLKSQLFGVEPHDPATVGWCIVSILVTVTVASLGPIRRALHVSPQQALRTD